MINSLLFTAFLSFSCGSSLLNEAPFKHSQNNQENSPYEYYTEYIDLDFFTNVSIKYETYADGVSKFFEIKAYIDTYTLQRSNVDIENFKYLEYGYYNDNGVVLPSVYLYEDGNGNYVDLSNGRLDYNIDKYGFGLVSDINLNGTVLNSEIATTWLDFERISTNATYWYEIEITIPATNPNVEVATALIRNNMKFFNQNYYDKFLYVNGYQEAYNDGYFDGINKGLTDGFEDGYDKGYNDGVASDFNSYSWLTGIFSAMGGLLSIQLLPGVSIGGILILIMVLTLLPFLIGLLKGGKG